MAQNQYIKSDKFGNPFQLIGCKANDKGFCSGYIELGGKLYKIEPSVSQNAKYGYWVKVTAVKKQAQHKSM